MARFFLRKHPPKSNLNKKHIAMRKNTFTQGKAHSLGKKGLPVGFESQYNECK